MEKIHEAMSALGLFRNKPKELDKLKAETKNAFDKADRAVADDLLPMMTPEGDVVTIRPAFKKSSVEYQRMLRTLADWITDELASERILIQNVVEDLSDGFVLAQLIGKLYENPQLISMQEIIPSETGQLQRIRTVLRVLYDNIGVDEQSQKSLPWSVELIYRKDELATVRLLIAIARHQRAPIQLPESLVVDLDVVHTTETGITHTVRSEDIAVPLEFTLSQQQTDEVDDLFDNNPDGIPELCSILMNWINDVLKHLGLEIYDLLQLHDGVYLLMMIGFLEGYYVPAYEYHLGPKNDTEKLHNVRLAFDHLTDAGIEIHPRVRPADIVNKNLRSMARFLVNLYQSYLSRKAHRDALDAARRTLTDANASATVLEYDNIES